MVLLNSTVIYVPALAFSQGTGTNIHVVSITICAICIFYTTIGGVKAVVWADTLQTTVMAFSMAVVFILGIRSSGGFWTVVSVAHEGQRLELEFGIAPTLRDSFWTFVIGATFHWTNHAVAQVTMQRLLAVPTLSKARNAIALSSAGIVLIKIVGVITGLMMFAKYSNCDPLLSKQLTRSDEMLPYYAMDIAKGVPGLSGLFISGILGASLSTLSGALNTVAATVYEDFLLPFMPTDVSETKTGYILKLIVITAGTICTVLIFVIENLGGLLPLTVSLFGVCGGALLGLFSLGMLFPVCNAKGALIGGVSGLLFSSCLVIGNLWYKNQETYVDPVKPLSVDGCSFPTNMTYTNVRHDTEQYAFYLFRLSFWYFTTLGTVVTILIGIIVSCLTRKDSERVHSDLLSPVLNVISTRHASKEVSETADTVLHLLTPDTKDTQV